MAPHHEGNALQPFSKVCCVLRGLALDMDVSVRILFYGMIMGSFTRH
ncbi:MAG: hypothetical protein RIR97_988 [Pseudomonadota bacterium]|jgi:hypothetical protein